MEIIYPGSVKITELYRKFEKNYPVYFTEAYHSAEQAQGFKTGFILNDDDLVMPFRVYKKLFFQFLQPLCPPLINANKPGIEQEKKFLNEIIIFLKKDKTYHRIMQPLVMDVFQTFPDHAPHCSFGQIFLEIETPSEDDIFAGFKSNYRNEIRAAIKAGTEIKSGPSELDNCYELYKTVHERQGIYHDPKSFFQLLGKHLIPGQKMQFYTAYLNNDAQCSALILYAGSEALYLFGGSQAKPALPGIIKLMQWQIIKEMKSIGIKRYIWGGCRLSEVSGTKQQGMQEFKLRFGSTIKKGFLWKYDVNPAYAGLYDLLMKIDSKLKGRKVAGDVIDYEMNREVII